MADRFDREAASYVDWWQLAGVDSVFHEAPVNWLEEAKRAAQAPAQPERPRTSPPLSAAHAKAPLVDAPVAEPMDAPPAPISILPQALPATLDAFVHWWLNDPAVEDEGIGPRIAPVGTANSAVMVLSDMPCSDDQNGLLTGQAGRLLDQIAQRAGLDPTQIYRASLFPKQVINIEIPMRRVDDWRLIALHHIALVAPKWVITLGDLTDRTLLGHGWSQKPGGSDSLVRDFGQFRGVASPHPRSLLSAPALKPRAWRAWQQLMGD